MFASRIVSSLENCFIDQKVTDFKQLEKMTVLKNERFSFQVICAFDEPAAPVRGQYFVKLDGALAKYASLREVISVPVTIPAIPGVDNDNYLRTTPGLYPDLLRPLRYEGKISVVKNNLSVMWVEVDLREAEDVIIGESQLSVSFIIDGRAISVCNLMVDVLDASLPEQTLKMTQWFYCDCLANYYHCEVWSERHWEIIENFAKTAMSNGINMLLTPVLTPPLDTYVGGERLTTQLVKVTKTEGGDYAFDFELLDRWIDMCDRVGIKHLEISHFFTQWGANHAPKVMATVGGEYKKIFGWETDATSPEYVFFLRSFIVSLLDHMKKRGDDKRCHFHISDEPTSEQLESYKAAKESIADLLEGYTVMDALSNYEFYSQGVVSTPIPCNDHITPFLNANVEGLWTYYCSGQWKDVSNRFLSMPSYRNRSIGMQMYKYEIVGFLNWGYNFYNTMRSYNTLNPYTDTCGDGWVPAGDTFSVYPAEDGTAYESLRIIVFHEALQDISAMKLAESLCGKETVVEAIENAFGGDIAFNKCARSTEQMIAVREAVNELIRANI